MTQETPTESTPASRLPENWQPMPNAGHTPFYYVAGTGLRLFYWLYGRWKIIGIKNVPKTGGVLIVANHVSNLDPGMLGGALFGYRRVRFMAKIELWGSRVGRYVMDRIMGFPVKRGTPDRATLRRALDWLAAGDAIGMFPEGERSADGKLQPAQPGVALLVQKSKVPVVPVAVLGTYESLPKGAKNPKRVPMKIVFGPPIEFPPGASREMITALIMHRIAELLTQHGQPTDPPVPLPVEPAAFTES